MASNASGSDEPTETGEAAPQERQYVEAVRRELVAVTDKITLCDAVLKDLKDLRDLTDILLRKSLQDESEPSHK